MEASLLRDKLLNTPHKPGVYIYKDEKNAILYVGKAKDLHNRIKSYFLSFDKQSLKTKALIQKIRDFQIIIVDNEAESLILENNLIKHNQPPYNILLRDDKTYPYIKVTLDETWPRVLLTRRKKNDKAAYFGPYSYRGQHQQLLNFINHFFPLVKCSPSVFKTISRPCNYHSIGQCLAPCHLKVDDYPSIVDAVMMVLKGKTGQVKKALTGQMLEASQSLNYEKAARLRDQIQAVEALALSQTVVLKNLDFQGDAIGFHWKHDVAVFYVCTVAEGCVVKGQGYVVSTDAVLVDEGSLSLHDHVVQSFLCQFYQKHDIPPWILIGSEACLSSSHERDLFQMFLDKQMAKDQENPKVYWSEKPRADMKKLLKKQAIDGQGVERLLRLATENAQNRWSEQRDATGQRRQRLQALQEFLGLPKVPERIECFDISTLQGAHTVASCVVFVDGQPSKKDYRKYIVKTVAGKNDDFASLQEILQRRLTRGVTHNDLPDVIVIDGGEPQIRCLVPVFQKHQLHTFPFVGLAKSRVQSSDRYRFASKTVAASLERVVFPQRDANNRLKQGTNLETKTLPESHPAFPLLTHLRDEAHRFAITFHRAKRSQEVAGF